MATVVKKKSKFANKFEKQDVSDDVDNELPKMNGDEQVITDENPEARAEELNHEEVLEQYQVDWDKDRHNIECAYEDLEMLAGNQWPEEIRNSREADSRPVLTFNKMSQYVRQVTGDMRQMRPGIKVVPVDDGADEDKAKIIGGLIRYIENRSDAKHVYTTAGDSAVASGIGHWEVFAEYADDTTNEQELGLRNPDDQVCVIWDANAKHPTRRDAMHCYVPVNMTAKAYKKTYPDHSIENWSPASADCVDWCKDDMIMIARYWYKVKIKRKLARTKQGAVEDLTGKDKAFIAKLKAEGAEFYERDGFQVMYVMMNGKEFITKPKKWPGRFIPMIPLLGEEVRIGSRVIRRGIIRDATDAQRAYNYARSTQTEVIGLQPKAPWLATDKMIKDQYSMYETANVKNYPVMIYTADPAVPGGKPERSAPPNGSGGIVECIQIADQDMQSSIGIYNSSLGQKSNETSGVAIQQRESQGDTGTFVYIDNFALSIIHTARVINDLIPHYYDTARTIRIEGIDGKMEMAQINQKQGLSVDGQSDEVLNDICTGSYDIQMELGPSYNTAREENLDGIMSLIKAFPQAAPILIDIVAKLQNWPAADEISKRLFTLLPPAIQAMVAKQDNDPSKMPPPPPPPTPAEQLQMQSQAAEMHSKVTMATMDVQKKQLEIKQQELKNIVTEFELLAKQMELSATGPQIDSGKLHSWIAHVDEALQMMNAHATQQLSENAQQSQQQQPDPTQQPQEQPDNSQDQQLQLPLGQGNVPDNAPQPAAQ